MTDLAVDHNKKRPFSLPVLTIADGLLLLLVGLAAILRLANLGRLPLSPNEAEHGLAAWQFWQPDTMTVAINSPLYFSLTTLASQLVGLTDATVRLIPALAGLALVASPILFRRWLGNAGVLISSLLLTISPLATIASRTAGGDALALLATTALAAGWLHWQTTGEKRWQTVTAVSIGLGLTTSPLFYTTLLTLGLAWWLNGRFSKNNERDSSNNESNPPIPQSLTRHSLLPTFLAFLAGSTLFLWHPAGIGAAAQMAGRWLAQFAGPFANIADPFLALLRYELPLLLTLIALAIAWGQAAEKEAKRPFLPLLTTWLLLTLLWPLLQQGSLTNSLAVILPAYLLLGKVGGDLFRQPANSATWWLGSGLLLLGMITFVNFARYLRLSSFNTPALSPLWFTTMGLLVAAFAIYMVWTWEARHAVYQGTLLALLGLCLFYQWGVGWNLAQRWGNDPRERWVATATDDDIRLLANLLRDVSRQGASSDTDLELFSTIDTPLLRWYLRPFTHTQFGTAVPANATQQAIITSANQTEPSFGSDYLGTDFGYLRPAQKITRTNSSRPITDTLRWWLFHTTPLPLTEERLIVWVRSDVAQP